MRCAAARDGGTEKGKYIYYHCTDYHGGCHNSYIREEQLAALLADVIRPIQISSDAVCHAEIEGV